MSGYGPPAEPSARARSPWKTNDNVSAGAPAPAPSATSTAAVAPEAAEVVDALKRACTKYSVRIHEFFQDFDRLRKGIVSRRQFEIALSMAFDGLDCQLSPAQISTLSDGFSTEDGRVRWHDVADAVDAVFTQKGLVRNPLSTRRSLSLTPDSWVTVSTCTGDHAHRPDDDGSRRGREGGLAERRGGAAGVHGNGAHEVVPGYPARPAGYA